MPTFIKVTIGSGGTHPTFSAAWSAITPNLVTADEHWTLAFLAGDHVPSTSATNFTGKTTDATRFIHITAETGASFLDNPGRYATSLRANPANGACLTVSGAYTTLNISQAYTKIDRLQIRNTNTTTSAFPALLIGSGASPVVDRCLIEGYTINTSLKGVVRFASASAGAVLSNSIVAYLRNDAAGILGLFQYACQLHNNTLVNLGGAPLTVGLQTSYASSVSKNNYVGGVVAPEDGTVAMTKTNCYSDATATGYATVAMAAAFENLTIGTHDLRQKPTSPLIDAGVANPTYAAVDVLGTPRPVGGGYDVGAHEYTSGELTVFADIVATYGVSEFASGDFSASYNLLGAGEVFNSFTATYGVAAFVAQDLAGTYSILSGGSFVSDAWVNNTDSLWPPGTAVYWTWTVAGRIGAMTGKTIVDGTGTLNAESKLALSGLPAGVGKLDGAVRGATAADDAEYSQHGTVG